MTTEQNRVIVVLDDLLFMVKIQDALKRAGLTGTFVKTRQDALAKAREHASLVIFDLNCAAAEPLETIAQLKSDEMTKTIPLLGYVSHVQTDLRKAAVDAGCDTVMARSVFVQNLAEVLLPTRTTGTS